MAIRGWGRVLGLASCVGVFAAAGAALADTPYSFTTGDPDGRMAMASRPASSGKIEIEAADDFTLTGQTSISSATFTGLFTGGASTSSIQDVGIEIYRVFPLDSNTTRTVNVPTRANSPSDVAFATRDAAGAQLTFTTSTISGSFTAANSVLNGIHPSPTQTTGGDGAVGPGTQARVSVPFTTPFVLPAGHYFFVPQVQVSTGQFYWLSAAGPTGSTDLQAWIRDVNLEPDWLRVGTDIVGGVTPPRFNGSFLLSGSVCPSISVSNPPPATVGGAYSSTLAVSGGSGPFSFSETGALPHGLSLSAAGGLSGTPTQSGSFPITVTVTQSNGCVSTAPATVTVFTPTTVTTTTTTTTTSTTTVSPTPAARLTALHVTPSSFTSARGAHVSFTLDRAAAVRLTFARVRSGRRGRHHRCEAPSRRNRNGHRCLRTIPLAAAVTVSGKAGRNSFALARPALAPAAYVLTATPDRGASRRATFTVRRPARPKGSRK